MRAQLARRRALLEAGDAPLGWKIGFGSPAALERLGTTGPLSGFLVRSALVPSGGRVAVSDWTAPVAEPEIAVHLAHDLSAGSRAEDAVAAIGAIGPAIELADVDRAPDDVDAILAGNVYQRAVVLGPTRAWPGSLRGLEAVVLRRGVEVGRTDEPEALTGPALGVLLHLAALLEVFGERLRGGDVVITGSVVAPFGLAAGDDVRMLLGSEDVAVRVAA